jgi:antitoxin component YwqK of YwqJK toxin-antitoxin module
MIGKSASRALCCALYFFLFPSCKTIFDPDYASSVSVINKGDSSIRFSLIDPNRRVKSKSKSEYFWFRSGKIRRTEGEFGGKLLNGEYELFGPDSELFQKGQFRKGMKKGTWKSWHPNGALAEIEKYRQGKKSGKVNSFEPGGKLRLSTRYSHGKKSGREKEFKNGIKSALRKYKDGDLVWEKTNAL